MASASLVAPTHQVVELAVIGVVEMASTSQVQAVPEGPVGPSTKQKKQSVKTSNNGGKKLKRPVSINTPHPSETQSNNGQPAAAIRPKHKRRNSSPRVSSTAPTPASPMAFQKSAPPSTRGMHLNKATQPIKHKRSSSLTKIPAAATAAATDVVNDTSSKVVVDKELKQKASPTGQARKEGAGKGVTTKKKKDVLGQSSSKRIVNASTHNMKQQAATKDPEKIGGAKPEPAKRLSASVHNIKTAINNSTANKSAAAQLSPKRISKIKTTFKEQESPGAGKARPSLSTAKQPKQAATAIKGKASFQSPAREGKPKVLVKKASQTVAKSPKKTTRTSILSASSSGDAPYIPKPKSTNDITAPQQQQQRKPESTTMLSLTSATTHHVTGKRSSLDSQQQFGALSPKPRNKRSSLDSVSVHHMSTTSSSLLMMPNQSERIHSQRRRAQDDDAITKTKHHSNKTSTSTPKTMPLTYFGNPLVPIDIVDAGASERMSKLNLMHHKDALRVLGEIKNMKRQQLNVQIEEPSRASSLTASSSSQQQPKQNLNKIPKNDSQQPPKKKPELKVIQLLKTAGTATSATLTMTGFKSEKGEQVNHDRSLIVSPFYLRNHSNSMVRRRLMGVFDGHAEHGAKFAEHCQQLLPSMLSRKLSEAFKKAVEDIAAGVRTREDEVVITKRVLAEAFVSMDESSPREATGGCTATVVYQQGQKVYVANTGDSRSFIAVYRKDQSEHIDDCPHQPHNKGGPSKQSKNMKFAPAESAADSHPTCARVVYMSREDKPDLPGERKRLEGWGGEIVAAEKNKSSKVKFYSNRPGKASATLSMSRSIGDWQFTPLGVIPDPLVDVLDLKELVEKEKKKDGDNFVDDVCIFAVCVSDGMMIESIGDAEAVASDLASSLFSDDGHFPLCACQSVIAKTCSIWDKRNKSKFRDDITVAMTVLRTPGGFTARNSRF